MRRYHRGLCPVSFRSSWDLRSGQRGQLDKILVAHTASVTSIDWYLPEGTDEASSSLGWIVSGGLDRTVKVWEQASYSDSDSLPNGTSGARWVERACLIDAKGTVRGVEFAPHEFGLKIVSTGH